MAVAYCGYIDGTVSAGTTTVSVNLSPGVAAVGQLAVVTIRRHSGYANPTTVPSGWTLLDSIEESTGHALVYYKTLAAGDLGTHTWEWALSRASVARATLYGGHNTSSPIEAVAKQYAASGDWLYAGSLTSDRAFHVAIFTYYSGSAQTDSTPSGYALNRGIVGSAAPALWIDVNDRDDWTGGEHNPAVFGFSLINQMGFHFAINPASTNRVTRGATIRGTNLSSSTSAAVSFAGAGLCTVGALAVVFISRAAAVNPTSEPTGWTLLDSYLSTYGSWVYYKILTADDMTTHTWSWAAAAKTLQHAVFLVGIDPAAPIPTGWNRAVATGSANTMEIGSVTTSRPFLLYLTSKYSTSARYTSTPFGYVEALDYGHTSPDFWHTIGSDPAWGGGTRNPAVGIYSDTGEGTLATATYRYGWQLPIAVAVGTGYYKTVQQAAAVVASTSRTAKKPVTQAAAVVASTARKTSKVLAGLAAIVASATRKTTKTMSQSATVVPTLGSAIKKTFMAVQATAAVVASVTRKTAKALTQTITAVASVVPNKLVAALPSLTIKTYKYPSASATVTATNVRHVAKTLLVSISAVPSAIADKIGGVVHQAVGVSATVVSSVSRKTTKTLAQTAAALASVSVVSTFHRTYTATVAAVTSVAKHTSKTLSAAASAAPVLESSVKKVVKVVQATAAVTASLTRKTAKSVSASAYAVTAVTRRMFESVWAAASAVPTTLRTTRKTLTGSGIGTATFVSGVKKVVRMVQATASVVASLGPRTVRKALSSASATVVSVTKKTAKSLAVAASVIRSSTQFKLSALYRQTVWGSANAVASVARKTRKVLLVAGAAHPTLTIKKALHRAYTASSAVVASGTKKTRKTLTRATQVLTSVTWARRFTRTLTESSAVVVSVSRTTRKALTASVSAVPSLIRHIRRTLSVKAAAVVSVTKKTVLGAFQAASAVVASLTYAMNVVVPRTIGRVITAGYKMTFGKRQRTIIDSGTDTELEEKHRG